MPLFQMVFRDPDGPRSEAWDNNDHGEPHINGTPIVDGQTYTIRGADWILNEDGDGHDGMKRFVCTLVVEAA